MIILSATMAGVIADQIRQHVFERHVEPARRRGEKTVTVTAGQVQGELKMKNRLPAVCSAIGCLPFQDDYGVRSGRLQSRSIAHELPSS